MKKFLFIFSIFLVFNCTPTAIEKKIQGTWQLVDFEQINPNIERDFSPEKQIILSTTYAFIDDKTVHVNGNVQGKVVGAFHIEEDSLILKYDFKGRPITERYKIIDVANDQMILEQRFENFGDFKFTLNKEF